MLRHDSSQRVDGAEFAVAFLQFSGSGLAGFVKMGVLDGDRSVMGQGGDQLLVLLAEFFGSLLVSQVQIAKHCQSGDDWNAEKTDHDRVVFWKPD